MATREQIARLKEDWIADPCWDIEDTEGFEEHRDELAKFAISVRDKYDAEREKALDEFTKTLGVPGNRLLAGYIMALEIRISRLEAEREGGDGTP